MTGLSIFQAMAAQLRVRLAAALQEFRREKVVRQNARMSLMHAIYDSASIPRRKLLLSTGGSNYRPPLERSKSAPKLGAIEETIEEEEEEEDGLGHSDEEEIDEIEAASVHMQPEEDIGGSSTVSETTSDIVVDYDSSSEVASAGQDQYVLDEEYEDDVSQFASPCHHSDSLLYCPVPPLSPLDDRPQHHKPMGVVAEARDHTVRCDSGRRVDVGGRDDLGLLASLTRELSITPPAEESLTSDQPESLGSHCDSCSSSCGACSDPCDVNAEQEHLMNESDHIMNKSHLITEGDSPGKMARLEGDNISEESGYSEDKDSLQNLDATKL